MSDTYHPLNIETVHHIANLVQLGLTDEEAAAFLPQLNAILEYFALLQEVDTESVPPAFLLPGAHNVLREDNPELGMSREAFLSNVPSPEGEYVSVPRVLEEA
jgi:aspartyl-tRNA(Asn)/glutamyl-tRNA(Gln) amidotransferase subunit C